MVARLIEKFRKEITPAMREQFGYTNPMSVPRLSKVVVSMGMGQTAREAARLETAIKELSAITGQKPVVCKSRKSISNFKLREGMNVGLQVTLRGQRMYEFLDRLITLAIPRVKDFRGLNPNSFDGRGNYNMGLTEQTLFPEVDPDKVQVVQGMNINITTTASTDEEARRLLTLFGMPFRTVEA
jgi:large subunit ribosomal protein L5